MIGYPCAKINLGLNIVSKRSDGYHNLETVFYPINLCDRLEITEAPTTAEHACAISVDGMPIEGSMEDNLVAKAYNLMKTTHPELPPINVRLTKNIPTQAGMGGGSSDCAYTITMLNAMFSLGMTTVDMRQLASTLGADCAFFIDPTPSFATGIGDELVPVNVDLDNYTICIIKPKLKISTKEAFAGISPQPTTVCCKDIVASPVEEWKGKLVNDFESNLAPVHDEIPRIKQKLYDLGAVYASMSGSGSAMFGIFTQVPTELHAHFPDCQCHIIGQ